MADFQYIVTYDELTITWGTKKIVRLSHRENSEDELVLRERIEANLRDVQQMVLGGLGSDLTNIPPSFLEFARGVIPPLLEYRLSPNEILADQNRMLLSLLKDTRVAALKEKEANQSNDLPVTPDDLLFVV